MKLAWNDDTPIKRNAIPNQPDARWTLRDELGIDIADAYGRMVYCDDETGDIWYLTEDEKGHPYLDLVTGKVCVSKICLGPKAFRCEWWPKGSIPPHVELAQFEVNQCYFEQVGSVVFEGDVRIEDLEQCLNNDSPFFRGGLIAKQKNLPDRFREFPTFPLYYDENIRINAPSSTYRKEMVDWAEEKKRCRKWLR